MTFLDHYMHVLAKSARPYQLAAEAGRAAGGCGAQLGDDVGTGVSAAPRCAHAPCGAGRCVVAAVWRATTDVGGSARDAGRRNAGRVRKKGGAWRDCAPRPETRPPPACPWMIGGWRVRGVLGWVKHRPDCVRRGGIGAEMRPELFGPGPHSGVGPTARHVATWPRTQRSGDGGRCPASARPPCGAG